MIPSWCKSMAWIAVFKTARTVDPGLLSHLGLEPLDWLAYGPIAIICVLTIHLLRLRVFADLSQPRSINPSWEEMGEILGAGSCCLLRKITFPGW